MRIKLLLNNIKHNGLEALAKSHAMNVQHTFERYFERKCINWINPVNPIYRFVKLMLNHGDNSWFRIMADSVRTHTLVTWPSFKNRMAGVPRVMASPPVMTRGVDCRMLNKLCSFMWRQWRPCAFSDLNKQQNRDVNIQIYTTYAMCMRIQTFGSCSHQFKVFRWRR